jgi:uncharacterized protein YndB with AHSA1/START domain
MTNETNKPAAVVGDREIAAARVFDAPPDVVFRMFTDTKHVSNWWGPRGFTTTTHSVDLRPGGVWRFTMHGPDGRDYPNRVTYTEVVEGKRLAYQHNGEAEHDPVQFRVLVTFDDLGGGRTQLNMRMTFPTPEARDFVSKYGAVEGLTDTLARFAEQLAVMA